VVQATKDRSGTDRIRFAAAMARTRMRVVEIGGRRIGHTGPCEDALQTRIADEKLRLRLLTDRRRGFPEHVGARKSTSANHLSADLADAGGDTCSRFVEKPESRASTAIRWRCVPRPTRDSRSRSDELALVTHWLDRKVSRSHRSASAINSIRTPQTISISQSCHSAHE
jgi:hypothetical protein